MSNAQSQVENRKSKIGNLLLALLTFWLVGCERPATTSSERGTPSAGPPAVPWFEDATTRSGVVFTHEVETSGRYLFAESMGSGAACLDFDNDGRLDLYLIHNVGPAAAATNRLFHQEADGRFKDVSAGSGLER